MTEIYISIGSNLDREHHIRTAVSELQRRFGELRLSSVYDSVAVGFDGQPFLNMVVCFNSNETPQVIQQFLTKLEDKHGRDRTLPKFSNRSLDLDLLLYGDQILEENGLKLPREEILEHAFVLAPLAQLAGELRHPQVHKSFAELWEAFSDKEQQLVEIPFSWTHQAE